MNSHRKIPVSQLFCWLLLTAAAIACNATAQTASSRPLQSKTHSDTIPVLMLSDVHFDPFHDPDRVQQLIHADIQQWPTILAPPSTPAEQQAFLTLQSSCKARGVDTFYSLLNNSLVQMRSWSGDAHFATLSGDLVVHNFSCRYKSLLPAATAADYQAFVVKTISFVMQQLRASFPGIPIYLALGNNDTPCGDYRLDPASSFLSQVSTVIASGLTAGEHRQTSRTLASGGYYSVDMAPPIQNTRLIVLNDLFFSSRYSSCSGASTAAPAQAELDWLKEQLDDARQLKQRVWIMGHIPPGIDPFSTFSKLKDVCGNDQPSMFLSSEAMASLMIEHADILRLGIFAHPHMDELRLLSDDKVGSEHPDKGAVVLKLVPSISPVDGNLPSFLRAEVNPETATLEDYQIIASTNQDGSGKWTREYDYGQAYHQADFTPPAVKDLIAKFQADQAGNTPISQQYMHDYFVGGLPEIKPFWPQYTCALANYTASDFAACVCKSK